VRRRVGAAGQPVAPLVPPKTFDVASGQNGSERTWLLRIVYDARRDELAEVAVALEGSFTAT